MSQSPPSQAAFLSPEVDLLTKELEDFEMKKAAARAVTGVLASHPNSTDVHIINLSLTFHGQELLSDTKLELNSGRRYGLIGLNGIGEALGRRGGEGAPGSSVTQSPLRAQQGVGNVGGRRARCVQGKGASRTEQHAVSPTGVIADRRCGSRRWEG